MAEPAHLEPSSEPSSESSSKAGAVAGGARSVKRTVPKPAKRSNTTHRWARILHTYTSMLSLLVVLFFSITGVTLNHPSWSIGEASSRSTVKGTLPAEWKSANGEVDWFVVSETLRSKHSLRGAVVDKRADEAQASLAFKGPGYAADAFIDASTGAYELTVDTQGFVGLMNDLHKGRDSSSSWRWLIDVVGVIMVVISITGLLMQFFLRRRRRSALASAALGVVVLLIAMWIATR